MQTAVATIAPLLVVDDDPAVLQALTFALELAGFEVTGVSSGEAALGVGHAACAVIDERLPGLSGLETLARLRIGQPELPAVLITTHPSRQLRRAVEKAGAELVEKPIERTELVSAIRKAIGTAGTA